MDTTFFKGCFDSRVNMLILPSGYISILLLLLMLLLLLLLLLLLFLLLLLLLFFPTDRPTITRDGAMGNETFFWDGLSRYAKGWHIISLLWCITFLLRHWSIGTCDCDK